MSDKSRLGSQILSARPHVIRAEFSTRDVQLMRQHIIDKAAVKKSVSQSTKASANLERRTVPEGFVRSERAQQYLAKRRQHG